MNAITSTPKEHAPILPADVQSDFFGKRCSWQEGAALAAPGQVRTVPYPISVKGQAPLNGSAACRSAVDMCPAVAQWIPDATIRLQVPLKPRF